MKNFRKILGKVEERKGGLHFARPRKVEKEVKRGSKNLCSVRAICASKSQNLCFSPPVAINLSVLGAEEMLASPPPPHNVW